MSNESQKTILVLEDEKSLLNIIQKKLEMKNFNVLTSKSVNEAFKHFQDGKKIDVIWLDHYLFGKENGLDFIAKIKQDSQLKKIPIFLISNTVTPKKIDAYMKLGVNKYYTKINYSLNKIIKDITDFSNQKES